MTDSRRPKPRRRIVDARPIMEEIRDWKQRRIDAGKRLKASVLEHRLDDKRKAEARAQCR